MNNIEPDYNYQVMTGGRSYGKKFLESRIKQAYKSGLDVGFIEKHKLIKYLEDKIKESKNTSEKLEGTGSFRIAVEEAKIRIWEDILEKVKSGKYE